jgi:hypothetical protein
MLTLLDVSRISDKPRRFIILGNIRDCSFTILDVKTWVRYYCQSDAASYHEVYKLTDNDLIVKFNLE